MPNTPEDEAFLSRWSRRKRAGEEPREPSGTAAEAPAPADSTEIEALSDEEILEQLQLPDPQTLKQGDDVSGFMAPQVPEHLRRMALRFLWRSNPVLANVDGLVDYGEDFTDAATVIENLQTVYEVGKGAAGKARAELDALAEKRRAEAQRQIDTGTSVEETPDRTEPEERDEEVNSGEDEPRIDVTSTGDIALPQSPVAVQKPKPARFRFE